MPELLFEISLLVALLGTIHWFSFKVLTAVAWGTIEASAAAYRHAHKTLNWLPSSDCSYGVAMFKRRAAGPTRRP